MTQAESFFRELTKEVPDATAGKMFGALCIKMPNGKAAAMFTRECLIVKPEAHIADEARMLAGVKEFEPIPGRPMNGWLQIPYTCKDKWLYFMLRSAEHVALLVKNTGKKRRQ